MSESMTGKRTATVHYYLHTHWDREWYLPFETFRAQLIATVRGVIASLEQGLLPFFMLDGQASILEDIVAVDSSLDERIRRLMQSDKLSAGPWYVLADQMLVSGESLVRNLKIGLKTTRLFGPPSMVGYCPDTFGHTQDMPRILSGFGIRNAVVWRGVPTLEGGPSFWWVSPDGSKVLAYFLEDGYYHAALIQDKEADVARFIERKATGQERESVQCNGGKTGSNGRNSDEILIPIGADHMAPDGDFSDRMNAIEEILQKSELKVALRPVQLQEFLSGRDYTAGRGGTPALDGELRENGAALAHGRAYLLQGVLSTRLYLKRANRIQENRITGRVEPLLAVLDWQDIFRYPRAELEHAWKLLLKNHPHDSICGCSVDAVHREMITRTSRFHQTLDAVEHQAACALSAPPAIRFARTAAGELIADPTADLRYLLAFNLDCDVLAEPLPFSFATTGDIDVKAGFHKVDAESELQIDESVAETVIYTAVGKEPCERHVVVHRGWLWCNRCDEHEGLGVKTMQWPVPLVEPLPPDGDQSPRVVRGGPGSLHSEYFDVTVDEAGALLVTFRASGKKSQYRLGHHFRDVADAGDEYNFDPIDKDAPVQSRFIDAKPLQKGPLVASMELQYEIDLPESIEALGVLKETAGEQFEAIEYRRSAKILKHRIKTRVTVKRGVPLLFFDSEIDNQASDHRLEIVFETGSNVSKTYSENHFSLVERPVASVEKLPVPLGHEAILDRYPCQRFFIANAQAFFNLGMPEYGVDGSCVTLTAVRAVSKLSRARLRTRGGGAGPSLDTPEGNCAGINRMSYGWAPLPDSSLPPSQSGAVPQPLCDQARTTAYRLADVFNGKGVTVLSATRRLERDGPWLSVNNQNIRLTALYVGDREKSIVVRYLNVSTAGQKAIVRVNLPFDRAVRCNLAEEAVEDVTVRRLNEKSCDLILDFGPNELVTLKLDALGRD